MVAEGREARWGMWADAESSSPLGATHCGGLRLGHCFKKHNKAPNGVTRAKPTHQTET